ncbi:MAG: hypothetical protein D6712_10775 [Chloroflexi bacterium]|nr:MAG: hypothetical protein D6712_10775 [Chloroflexota bacterium]
MIRRFLIFLGPARARALLILLGGTGLLSLMLNAVEADPSIPLIQNLLVLIFLVGAAIIILGRLSPQERLRWLAILSPAIGALVIAVFFFPEQLPIFAGAALGWVVAGVFMFRSRAPMQYREAVRHLRKNEYQEAVAAMDALIKEEPNDPNHYRFRAELLRLWGKLGRARRDYRKMIELDPQSAIGYNGLAEVCLQAGDYTEAHEAALQACELVPNEWVALYNLGMIEDRLELSQDAIVHLEAALQAHVSDKRHRLLIHLYRARAYARLGDLEKASAALNDLRKEQGGIEEWELILNAEQAAVLREVLADDVAAAKALLEGEMTLESLAGGAAS